MVTKLLEIPKKIWNRIAAEPAITLGVVVVAVNTATDQTWRGYAAAVGIALFRFAVSPALPKFDV